MRKPLPQWILIVLILLLIWLYGVFTLNTAAHADYIAEDPPSPNSPPLPAAPSRLSLAQSEWLWRLEECESGHNPLAHNPRDTNGEESNGLYQFQRPTWRGYNLKYLIYPADQWEPSDFENNLWDGKMQRAILEEMLFDKSVRWQNEFPGCVKKIGLPPGV